MSLQDELLFELISHGADFVHFVDITQLSDKQNKQYPNAILIGIVLSPGYIQKIIRVPDYVEKMIQNNLINEDEFHVKEKKTDILADYIAEYLKSQGYASYSQSEKNIYSTGHYDEKRQSTPLPHKTIAGLAGIGWIGKHNLLVTPEFGSAISMCSILTDAPINSILNPSPHSQCGDCQICKNICTVKAIEGNTWNVNSSRDQLVNVNKCTSCLKCLAICPWSQKYVKRTTNN